MLVEILGIPSERTRALEASLREALAYLDPDDVVVRRVTDPAAIIARGARRWPALRVDGRLVCAGVTPSAAEIRAWLSAAQEL